ncbi:unnamed protein product [Rotaria sp. Silwood1]|nr:unnamed protein product [Rotaria sp. Silwood1]
MDQVQQFTEPCKQFIKDSYRLIKKCTKPDRKETLSEYCQGLLTYVEPNKPYVYIQLLPESELIIEKIDQLIDKIINENKRNSSYEIGDHVIAQFTQDDHYYRARIESYSTSTNFYTVYFIDYDTNEKNEIILSNSSDIVNIDEQKTSQIENNNNNDQSDDITNVTENSSSLSMSNNNQTIDFGENDSLTTIKDETNDSISSN